MHPMQYPPIKVAYITTVPVIGGAELNLARVLPFLGHCGVEPAVVLAPPGGGLLEFYREQGFPVRSFHLYGKKWRSFWRYYQSLIELAAPIISSRADLIHINHHYGLEYTTLAARLAHRPCIVHVRGIEPIQWVTDNLPYLTRAARVIAVSHAVEKRLVKSAMRTDQVNVVYNGLGPESLEVIHDGVVESGGTASNAGRIVRDSLHIPETAPLVGLVARLEPLKGGTDFLIAGSIIRRTLPELKLAVVGAGAPSYVAELRALAGRLDMADDVIFTGFRSDVPAILDALDVLVVATYDPLTGQGEAFANIALEAMRSRTPVVARRVGGIVEILDGGHGLLVDPDGAEPLVHGIITALNMSPDERQAMIEKAYETVSTRFTLAKQAQQVRAVYDAVLGKNRG